MPENSADTGVSSFTKNTILPANSSVISSERAFCQALGDHLRKEIHDQCGDQRSVDNEFLVKLPQNQQGGQRSAGGVEHIVADKNCGEGFVEAVTDPEGLFGALVTFVCHGAQTNFAYSGKSSFCAGAVSRTK